MMAAIVALIIIVNVQAHGDKSCITAVVGFSSGKTEFLTGREF